VPKDLGRLKHSENFNGSDYTEDEVEFIKAMAAYQKKYHRRFPSWSDALRVLKSLGYRKVATPDEDGR
jgi:hypothetical protein